MNKTLQALPLLFVLSACSTTSTPSSVPMDMQAVQDYQERVRTGNTINPNAKDDEKDLNHSDRAVKTKVYYTPARIGYAVYPMIYYGW